MTLWPGYILHVANINVLKSMQQLHAMLGELAHYGSEPFINLDTNVTPPLCKSPGYGPGQYVVRLNSEQYCMQVYNVAVL